MLLILAVPPNPKATVCEVVPADLLTATTISNSYTVLADSVTPTPKTLCAPVALDPA